MNPNGLRVGIIKDWNSKWYADSKHFADYLVEDHKIREYVKKNYTLAEFQKLKLREQQNSLKLTYTQLNLV